MSSPIATSLLRQMNRKTLRQIKALRPRSCRLEIEQVSMYGRSARCEKV